MNSTDILAVAIILVSAVIIYLSITSIRKTKAKKTQVNALKEKNEELNKRIEKLEDLASKQNNDETED